jgi:hypothetical protein
MYQSVTEGAVIELPLRVEREALARLQLVSMGLTAFSPEEIAAALANLQIDQPIRWRAFVDDALVLIDRLTERSSAFGETVRSELSPLEASSNGH